MGKESRCNLSVTQASYHYDRSLYYKITLLIKGQLTRNQKRNKITLRDSSSIATLTAPLNTVSNMKSMLLASNFLIVGHVLQNLCEIVTRSGKELKCCDAVFKS